jgi:hypothetical protein
MTFEEKLAELKAAHEDAEVFALEAAGVKVICRTPKEGELARFEAEMEKDKGKRPLDATKKLFRQCCLHPSLEELTPQLKRKPGLALSFGSAILTEAGFLEESMVTRAGN